MKNRIIVHPINGDKVTFLKTCSETNGELIQCELEVFPNAHGAAAAPPHYHKSYTESFRVLEGELTVRIGNKVLTLGNGQSVTIPLKTVDTFSNKTLQSIKAIVEARPAIQGFEDGLIITYGLAADGKTSKTGLPKSVSHLALLISMGDIRFADMMSVLNPVMRWMAKKAIKWGIKQELSDAYVNNISE